MAKTRNTFSSHILSTGADEVEETGPAHAVAPTLPPPIQQPSPVQSRAETLKETEAAPENKIRPDYRKTRASKEGKKYINVLINEELQSELKPRMVTRKLTWESLIEGLLQRWLEENPGYKP